MKKILNIIQLLLLTSTVCLYFFLTTYNWENQDVLSDFSYYTNKLGTSHHTSSLNKLSEQTTESYPLTKISPSSIFYPIIIKADAKELDNISYAHKRISELRKYNNKLKVEHWINSIRLYKQAIYMEQDEINAISNSYVKNTKASKLKKYLELHRKDLTASLNESSIPKTEKTLIETEIKNTFSNILKRKNYYLFNDNSTSLYPKDIIEYREYGIYDISFNINSEEKNTEILVNFNQESRLLKANENNQFFLNNVEISSPEFFLTINASDSKKHMEVFNNLNQVVAKKIGETNKTIGKTNLTRINNHQLMLNTEYIPLSMVQLLLDQIPDEWTLKLVSSDNTSSKYLISNKNHMLINNLLRLSFILFILSVLFSLLQKLCIRYKNELLKVCTNIFSLIKKIISIISNSLIKIRLILFIALCCSFFINLFLVVSPLPYITLISILLWFVIRESYKLNIKSTFYMWIIPLLLIYLTTFIKIRPIFQLKISQYLFVFLVLYCSESIFSLNKIYKNNISKFMYLLKNDFINNKKDTINFFCEKLYKYPRVINLIQKITHFFIVRKRLIVIIIFSTLPLIQIVRYYLFFVNFFIENEFSQFYSYTGKFFLIALIILISSFILTNIFIKSKILEILIFYSITCCLLQFSIFNTTTDTLRSDPYIELIDPNNTELWDEVTIKGQNFGEAKTANTKVYINDVEHRILRWENRRVIFITNPVMTTTGKVRIETENNKKSNEINFTYNKK